ncbi:MAG: putative toxin-antitoxin system toxin component, PIN family [Anaerolineae bacterium]|nr:putative toxin-antitoxin system toxin component, PIN family [Candidatus Roseilinea sp.]MDW8451373.1 putative toxin-antitoxin system toxin component, PIN family [Anaerolineae bacterium]
MIRFFVDTSVLFAAIYSPTGGSARLITDAINREIELVISEDVASELRGAIGEVYPQLLPEVETLLQLTPFIYVTITQAQRDEAVQAVVDPDDAHIVAAAKISHARALITLDRKHLLDKPIVAEFVGMDVLTPGQAIALYRE